LKEQGLSSFEVLDSHLQKDGKKFIEDETFWESLAGVLKAIPHTKKDQSMSQALQNLKKVPEKRREIVKSFIQGFDAALIKQVSANEMKAAVGQVADPTERQTGRLLEGYTTLLHAVALPFQKQIQLNTQVRQIHWEKDSVEIHAQFKKQKEIYRARKVLITVPVSVLPFLTFYPALPAEKKEALHHVKMGPVIKLGLEFKKDFWTERFEKIPSYFHSPKLKFQTWWTAAPMHWPLITAWSGGDPALKLSKLSDAKISELAITELAKCFNLKRPFVQSQLQKIYFHNWEKDPLARGAYSFVRAGGKGARKKLAEPIAHTLYFAGEATSEERNGTVDGAICSGIDAVQKMLQKR
jgi:monoamine oxidase